MSQVFVAGLAEAQKRADNAVIETEKFKATVAYPPGESLRFHSGDGIGVIGSAAGAAVFKNSSREGNFVGNGTNLTDDDFFHLICHIDVALKQKIEKGDYVDLDKLLPRDKANPNITHGDYEKLEWVQSEGSSFLVPAKRQSRINSFRR